MKTLETGLKLVPKNKFNEGHSHKIYTCENNCLIPENDIKVIRVRKSVTRKCPYCGSEKLTEEK